MAQNKKITMYELNKINEEKLKKTLEKELHKDPQNMDILFKLAILEIEPPEGDDIKCIAYLEQILAFNQDNAEALILLAYLKYSCLFEEADEHLMNKLTSLKSPSNELNSMLRYAASCFFPFNGSREKQILLLKESISFDPKNVWSYIDLAYTDMEQGKNLEAKELVKKAFENIKKIYTDNPSEKKETSLSEYNEASLSDFLNHHIKGIYVTDQQLIWIKGLLEQ